MPTLLINFHVPMNEARWKVLRDALPGMEMITCKEPGPTPEQLAKADFILGNPAPDSLKHCRNLKLLQLRSAGADEYLNHVPKGVVMATSGGSLAHSVAEHMLGMLLAMMKHLDIYVRNMSQGIWKDAGPARTTVGSTTLIVGLGSLGAEFAWRMKALGSHVIGVRRAGTDKPDSVDELYLGGELDGLLPRADFVALFLPNTGATRNLLDRRRLSLMKDDAYLLNAGRGNAIDQDALCDLMDAGKLAGAGLDVTVPEPLPPTHRLWKTPRVLICPHIAGTNHLAVTGDYIVQIAVRNIAAFLTGGELASVIDLTTGYRTLPARLPKPLSQR